MALVDINGEPLFYTSCFQRIVTIAASSGVYTLPIEQSNFFAAGAAITGNTTISLSNLSLLPASCIWPGFFEFSYSSGAITWPSNSGYTVKWENDTALVPVPGKTYRVSIEIRPGLILLTADRGRTT